MLFVSHRRRIMTGNKGVQVLLTQRLRLGAKRPLGVMIIMFCVGKGDRAVRGERRASSVAKHMSNTTYRRLQRILFGKKKLPMVNASFVRRSRCSFNDEVNLEDVRLVRSHQNSRVHDRVFMERFQLFCQASHGHIRSHGVYCGGY